MCVCGRTGCRSQMRASFAVVWRANACVLACVTAHPPKHITCRRRRFDPGHPTFSGVRVGGQDKDNINENEWNMLPERFGDSIGSQPWRINRPPSVRWTR